MSIYGAIQDVVSDMSGDIADACADSILDNVKVYDKESGNDIDVWDVTDGDYGIEVTVDLPSKMDFDKIVLRNSDGEEIHLKPEQWSKEDDTLVIISEGFEELNEEANKALSMIRALKNMFEQLDKEPETQ